MKKLIVCALIGFAGSAIAADSSCDAYSETARSIMDGRQNGVTIKQSMAIANAAPNSELKEFVRSIVILAYEQPAYSTEPTKRKAIDEFGNKFSLECEKAKS